MATVVIPLYEGVTHLDVTGPHQLLACVPGMNVVVASLGGVSVDFTAKVFHDNLQALISQTARTEHGIPENRHVRRTYTFPKMACRSDTREAMSGR